jgi:hypothetical protein
MSDGGVIKYVTHGDARYTAKMALNKLHKRNKLHGINIIQIKSKRMKL